MCIGGGKEMTIINYFFEIVVPQILEYFKENKEEIPNYSIALPSFVNQSKLITEIMEYEKKISEARKIMLSCPLRKQAVLDECLN